MAGNHAGLKHKTNTQMKNYTLEVRGRSKIAAALAKKSQAGQPGEILIRSGCNQSNFCLFLVRLAIDLQEKEKDESVMHSAFNLVSGGNCSAAQKAMAENLDIIIEGEKKQSLSAYWGQGDGGPAVAPDLSVFD